MVQDSRDILMRAGQEATGLGHRVLPTGYYMGLRSLEEAGFSGGISSEICS